MESSLSYHGYGNTAGEQEDNSVATVNVHPRQLPRQRGHERQALAADVGVEKEQEFSAGCLNKLNQYLISKYKPPTRRAKPYRVLTILNVILGIACCACCACPCYFLAHKLSKSVNILNRQGDYLSARTRSCYVMCCNITAFIFIFIGNAATITVLYFIITAILRLFGII